MVTHPGKGAGGTYQTALSTGPQQRALPIFTTPHGHSDRGAYGKPAKPFTSAWVESGSSWDASAFASIPAPLDPRKGAIQTIACIAVEVRTAESKSM